MRTGCDAPRASRADELQAATKSAIGDRRLSLSRTHKEKLGMLFLLRKHRCRGCGTSIEANYVFAGSRCTPCHNAWMEREREFEKARREQRIAEIEEGVKRALGQLRSKVT